MPAVLRLALRRRGVVLSLLLLLFAVVVGLAPRVGTEYMPKADEGDLRVRAHMAPGIQFRHLHRQARRIEQSILESVPARTAGNCGGLHRRRPRRFGGLERVLDEGQAGTSQPA